MQRNEFHQVQYVGPIIVHKTQRPLKLHQVQHISKTGRKVQQSIEVSQQQYMDMNVDVPAEMQRQNTVTNALMRRQVRTMPGGIID